MTESNPTDSSDQRASMIGIALSILTAAVWAIWAMTGAKTGAMWIAVALSVICGFYWAFGRRLFFGVTENPARNRARYRNRG